MCVASVIVTVESITVYFVTVESITVYFVTVESITVYFVTVLLFNCSMLGNIKLGNSSESKAD